MNSVIRNTLSSSTASAPPPLRRRGRRPPDVSDLRHGLLDGAVDFRLVDLLLLRADALAARARGFLGLFLFLAAPDRGLDRLLDRLLGGAGALGRGGGRGRHLLGFRRGLDDVADPEAVVLDHGPPASIGLGLGFRRLVRGLRRGFEVRGGVLGRGSAALRPAPRARSSGRRRLRGELGEAREGIRGPVDGEPVVGDLLDERRRDFGLDLDVRLLDQLRPRTRAVATVLLTPGIRVPRPGAPVRADPLPRARRGAWSRRPVSPPHRARLWSACRPW